MGRSIADDVEQLAPHQNASAKGQEGRQHQRWTTEEVSLLDQYHAAGMSFEDIAKQLSTQLPPGHNAASCSGIYFKLRRNEGTQPPGQSVSGSRWTGQEDTALRKYRAEGMKYEEIALQPLFKDRRDENACRGRHALVAKGPRETGWTKGQDELLRHYRDEKGMTWENVAKQFGNRAEATCRARHMKNLARAKAERAQLWSAPSSDEGKNPKKSRWTKEEDQLLRECRSAGMPLMDIATQLPHRSVHACTKRTRPLLDEDSEKPKGTRWTKEEDQLLREDDSAAMPWPDIAKHFPHRSLDALKRRIQRMRKQEQAGSTQPPESSSSDED